MTVKLLCAVSAEEICAKLNRDIVSMGYEVKTVSLSTDAFEISAKKDLTPVDFVLGRQQQLVFSAKITPFEEKKDDCTETYYLLSAKFVNKAVADKIFCLISGVFFFCISWIYCFIAAGNIKETKSIAETSIRDYATKKNSLYTEKTD